MKKGIQAWVSINLITNTMKFGIAIIIIPSIVFICLKLLNNILTDTVMEIIENCLNNVDYLIWSKYTNIILSIVSLVLAIKIAKRIQKILIWWEEKNN